LIATVRELLGLQKSYPTLLQSKPDSSGGTPHDGATIGHSTDTIANIIGANSGPALALAAAAHLHFVKKKQTFTRLEIVAEMRTATGHWKESYSGNMTSILNGLKGSQKDQLRLISKDTFALSSKAKQELEGRLANTQ
jgi:hypothetical protein